MEIIYKKTFVKNFEKLPNHVKKRVLEVMDELIEAETLQTSNVDFTPIQGQKEDINYYRIRVGDYRIGIEVIEY